jgi:hypothetical protein
VVTSGLWRPLSILSRWQLSSTRIVRFDPKANKVCADYLGSAASALGYKAAIGLDRRRGATYCGAHSDGIRVGQICHAGVEHRHDGRCGSLAPIAGGQDGGRCSPNTDNVPVVGRVDEVGHYGLVVSDLPAAGLSMRIDPAA